MSSARTETGIGKAGRLPLGNLWRQARRDLGPLAVGLVVIAVASFLATAVPQLLTSVATAVVQDAVAHPSRPPELVITVPVDSFEVPRPGGAPDWYGERIEAGLPADLRGVLAPAVTSLVGPELKAGAIAGRPGRVRFIYVHSTAGPGLTWLEGRAPVATGDLATLGESDPLPPIEVALSEAAAALVGVQSGDPLPVVDPQGAPLDVWVSGVYRPTDPADDAWKVTPTLLKPQLVDGSAAVASVGLLVSAESLPFAMVASPTSMTRSYTYPVIASRIDAANAGALAVEARSLAAGRKAFDLGIIQPRIHTNFDTVIDAALARVAAGSAQASVLLLGLLATALLVVLLVAGLLVERRADVLKQWRARGATRPAIAVANLFEPTLIAVLGGGLGLAAAGLLFGGMPPPAWVAPTLLMAVLPQPLLAVRAVGEGVRGAGVPAGRTARLSTARARRLAAELTFTVVAVAALATVVVRGVVASAGSVLTDIVVLAAPVLVALAVALGLTRLQPRGAALARRLAGRRAEVVPLLAAARVRSTGLATAALVVSCAVAAIATTVAATVSRGQPDASWDAVGAEAMITSTAPDGLPTALIGLDGDAGITVATAATVPSAQLLGVGLDRSVSVVGLDAEAFARLLAATGTPSAELSRLTAAQPGVLPVLVSGLPTWDAATVRWGDERVAVQAVGIAPVLPAQLRVDEAPTVVADRRMLGQALGHEVAASRGWIVGPEAVLRLRAALAGADVQLLTRDDWLATQARDPLRQALSTLFAGATGVAAGLAGLVVALMAAAGAGQRTRSAAQLRVVGLPAASARRVSWLEVAVPAVVTGVAGLAVGIGLSWLLVGALDLSSVTGGRQAPHLVVAWASLLLPVALGILAHLSVLVAGLPGRRVPLGSLMRAG